MNKILKIILIGLGILTLAGGLFITGVVFAQRTFFGTGWSFPLTRMWNGNATQAWGRHGFGSGMMGNRQGYGPGMMSGYGTDASNLSPLTVDEAYQSAGQYLADLGNSDLKIAEVMVFNNNAYIRVIEESTGTGAFELLVDPLTNLAYPEPGPNMMWNLKYGGLFHSQMMGGGRGMMGGYAFNSTPQTVSAEMTVSSKDALKTVQDYLDKFMPGASTAEDADPFYGYYTLDILRDGKTIAMLSVNGFNGQVFLHTWHGTFIEEKEY